MIKTPKTHILLCDDDANSTTVLADYLRDKGYEVVIASDGEDGLRKLTTDRCDICLLDMNMPKSDGFEMLNTLRTSNSTLPVIMLMETNTLQAIVRAYTLGCDDYMAKPL
jgi:DNA-binding response OmpR family regulator